MAFDVAASYLSSFRPIGPVEGFENVKSTIATEALLRNTFENQRVGAELANTALGALGQIKETQLTADANLKAAQMRIDWERELANRNDKNSRRMAGIALLSAPSGLAALLGGGGGGSNSRARDAQDDNYNYQRQLARQNATARSDGLAAGMMKLVGLG